jgi:hypothetical protein
MAYAHIWTVRAPISVYDTVWAEIGTRPDGLILHLVTPGDDGFHIIEVWETAEHSDRFAGAVLAPAVARTIGELPPGERTILPIHNLLRL